MRTHLQILLLSILSLLTMTGVAIAKPQPASGPPAAPEAVTLDSSIASGTYQPGLPVVVVVDKEHHLTRAFQLQNGSVVEVLQIHNAIGKPSTPSPTGRTTVKEIQFDPVWTPPVSIDPLQRQFKPYSKDKRNPLGVVWIGTNLGSVGLHGTNAPKEIGKSVSHGCIRHKNEDALKLAAIVTVGTPVYFVRHFDGTKVKSSDFASAP